jgi:hypothetical protein
VLTAFALAVSQAASALDCPPDITSAVTNGGADITIAAATTCNITSTGSLALSQKTLTNNGTINNAGSLSATLAEIDNYGTIQNQGQITNGHIGTFFNYGNIANSGTFTNSQYISNQGVLINHAGGVLTSSSGLDNPGSLTNAGTLANTGTLNIGSYSSTGASLVNTGGLTNGKTLNVLEGASLANSRTITNSGAVGVQGNLSNEGEIQNTGTLSFGGSSNPAQTNDGQIVNSGYLFTGSLAGTGTLLQTAGTLELGDTTQSAVTIQGGLVRGFDGALHGDLDVLAGTVAPGIEGFANDIPSTITIDGDLGLADRLRIGLSGTETSIFGYGRLDVTGAATLGAASTLEVNLLPITPHSATIFTPQPGDTFDILVASAIFGSFENVILPSVTGVAFDLDYLTINGGDQLLRLTAVAAPVPLPAAIWLFGPALAGIGGIVGGRRGKATA